MLGKCTQQLVDAPVDIATRTPACLPLGGCFLRAIKNSHMSKANTHKHIESETMALAKGKKKRRGGAENSGVGMGMGREPGSQWLLATLLQFSNGPNAQGATTATTCPCPGRLCYSSCSQDPLFHFPFPKDPLLQPRPCESPPRAITNMLQKPETGSS